MPPTSKDNEVLVATPEAPTGAPAPGTFRPDETASRPSPVALEVPVSVNGARTVEGSDKREPFSETTKTVLVFGNGAVIRLASPVSPGQLLFLTNEKTKKEVVCQVVKSKNYRNVSGYVELEFTESVVGFWGMRFPTDRIAVPAPTATSGVNPPQAVKMNPAAPKVAAPAVNAAPKAPEVRPAAGTVLPPAPKPTHQAPVAQAKPPVATAPAETAKAPEASAAPTIAASLASSVANLLGSPEVPPGATPKAPAPPARDNIASTQGGNASTEELKQQAARLQEQLSSMLFGGAPTATQPSTPSANQPPLDSKPAASPTSRVLEMARPEPLAPPKLSSTGKPAPPPIKSSLDTEEVKIPSWLEPLARNAAAPTSTQELIEREKARQAAEMAAREREDGKPEVLAAAAPQAAAASTPEAEVPDVTGLPPLLDSGTLNPAPTKSKAGLWIGVAAAGILAAAGGAWYFMHPMSGGANTVAQSSRATVAASRAPAPAIQPPSSSVPGNAMAASQPVSKPTAAVPQPLSSPPAPTPAVNTQPVPNNREARAGANTIPAASTERIARSTPPPAAAQPAKPEPKKPSLGEVHLASPTVNHSDGTADDGMTAPTISGGTDAAASAGLGSELGAAGQPAAPKAPLAVGGDVKAAKLVNSTPPIYPTLAKTQHIAGDVSIDALIDATGKVTTMKVLSGPTLLRQAAMDAVRQWKYQPATLDGNAVSMHLTVTVQFRIQ